MLHKFVWHSEFSVGVGWGFPEVFVNIFKEFQHMPLKICSNAAISFLGILLILRFLI